MGIKKEASNITDIGQKFISFGKELENILDDSIRDSLDRVEEDLDMQFSRCVDAFYNEYTPTSYDRTYSLYEGWKFNRGKNGLKLYWETSGSLIPDTHRASPQYIFDLTYEYGQHGGNIGTGLIIGASYTAVKGSPINDRIMRVFDTYKKSNQLQLYFNHYSGVNFKRKIKEYGLDNLF